MTHWFDISRLAVAELSLRLTVTLIHFLWQGVLVGVIVVTTNRLLHFTPSRNRYTISLAGLILMLACLPVTFILVRIPGSELSIWGADRAAHQSELRPSSAKNEPGSETAVPVAISAKFAGPGLLERGVTNTDIPTAMQSTVQRIPKGWGSALRRAAPYANALYLLGVVLMLIRVGLGLCSGKRIRSDVKQAADRRVLDMVTRQAQLLGLKCAPAIGYCHRVAVPTVVGVVKPVILLPTSLATGLTAGELESLLAHELAHIRRYDLVANLLQRVIEAVLFFHPAVWYVSRRVSLEREHACDDSVLSTGRPRMEYVAALLRMAEVYVASRGTSSTPASLAALGDNPSQFKRRVLRLLGERNRPSVRLTGLGVATATVMLISFCLTPMVLHSWAQSRQSNQHSASEPRGLTALPTTAGTAGDQSQRTDLFGDDLPRSAVARMGTVRFRQGSIVWDLAVSPSGKRLASVGDDNSLCLWEADTGRQIARIQRRGLSGRSVTFAPDGKRLAVATDRSIRLLDLETLAEVSRIETEGVRLIRYAPDGQEIVAACGRYATRGGKMSDSEGTLRVFDVSSGRERVQLHGHQGYISSFAVSRRANTIASASHDNTVRLWDLTTGDQLRLWTLQSGLDEKWLNYKDQSYVALSPDGTLIAFTRPDNSIRIHRTGSGQRLHRLVGHDETVVSIAFSADGQQLVSGGRDDTVRIWNVTNGRQLHCCRGHESWVQSVAFSPRGTVVSGSQDHTIRVWDSKTGTETQPFDAHGHWIFATELSPDGRQLATGGCEGLRLWDVASGGRQHRISDLNWVRSLSYSPDGRVLAAGCSDGSITTFEAQSGRLIRRIHGHTKVVRFVRVLGSGKRLLSAGDRSVVIWDLASGKMLRRLPANVPSLQAAAISEDEKTIALIGEGGHVRLANIATGNTVIELQHPGRRVRSIAFSPDGSLYATAGDASLRSGLFRTAAASSTARAICIWDARTGEQIRQLERPPETVGWTKHRRREVHQVAFAPDGTALATAESDGAILIFDVASGALLNTLKGHTGPVSGLCFSADGELLCSSGRDDLVALVWRLKGKNPGASGGFK